MEAAAIDLEAEFGALEKEAEDMLEHIKMMVGDLSDLRYGKFDKQVGGDDVVEVVLEGLRGLEEVCEGLPEG
jgi:centromere-localized protein 2